MIDKWGWEMGAKCESGAAEEKGVEGGAEEGGRHLCDSPGEKGFKEGGYGELKPRLGSKNGRGRI